MNYDDAADACSDGLGPFGGGSSYIPEGNYRIKARKRSQAYLIKFNWAVQFDGKKW